MPRSASAPLPPRLRLRPYAVGLGASGPRPTRYGKPRHFLAVDHGDSPLTADALACLSELATNSVLHSSSRRPGGSFTVHALLYPEVLRVEVQDEGGPWEPGHDQDDRSGHGLVIVDGLSTDWSNLWRRDRRPDRLV